MIRIISLFLALVLGVFVFISDAPPTYRDAAAEIKNPYELSITETEGEERDLLRDDSLRQLYDVILKGLVNFDEEIVIKRLVYEEDDLMDVIRAIRYDRPDIFWINWNEWQILTGNNGITVMPLYYVDELTGREMNTELNGAVRKFVFENNSVFSMSDYDKILTVHDWMIKNVHYEESYNMYPDSERWILHTAYGALVNGTAVCDGYAAAFNILMERFGVKCLLVDGVTANSVNDEGHQWNIVYVEDKCYHIDVTWDDINIYGGGETENGFVSYQYFLLSDDEISNDHTADSRKAIPACPDIFGYYASAGLEGRRIEEILGTVAAYSVAAVGDGSYTVEFRITDDEGYTVAAGGEFDLSETLSEINSRLEESGNGQRIDETGYRLAGNDARKALILILFPDEDE